MSAESDVMVVAGILALLYRITPVSVSEGPAGTATRNYVAEDCEGRRWFVKAYPRGTGMEAERQALALGEAARAEGVPVPSVRRTVTGEVIASAGGLSVSVTEYVAGAETAEGGLSSGRWDAVGETVARLHRALHRYLRWRNANARHPDVLAAQRRERARIRSEKGIRWDGRARCPAA